MAYMSKKLEERLGDLVVAMSQSVPKGTDNEDVIKAGLILTCEAIMQFPDTKERVAHLEEARDLIESIIVMFAAKEELFDERD